RVMQSRIRLCGLSIEYVVYAVLFLYSNLFLHQPTVQEDCRLDHGTSERFGPQGAIVKSKTCQQTPQLGIAIVWGHRLDDVFDLLTFDLLPTNLTIVTRVHLVKDSSGLRKCIPDLFGRQATNQPACEVAHVLWLPRSLEPVRQLVS